jgi:hypothetical protein
MLAVEEEVDEMVGQLSEFREKLQDMASQYPAIKDTIEAYIIPNFDDMIGEGSHRNPYNQSLPGLIDQMRDRMKEERERNETPMSRNEDFDRRSHRPVGPGEEPLARHIGINDGPGMDDEEPTFEGDESDVEGGSRFDEHGDFIGDANEAHVEGWEDEDLNAAELAQKVASLEEDGDEAALALASGTRHALIGKLAIELKDAVVQSGGVHGGTGALVQRLAAKYPGVPSKYINAAAKRVRGGGRV